MDGYTFVTKLESLKIEGVHSLKADNFDWVFLDKKNQPLSLFWKCFFANVCSEDVLSPGELNGYEELLATGSVLSSNHLMQLESYLGPVVLNEETQFSLEMNKLTEEDVDRWKKELKKMKMRKNQLSLERLEVEERVRKKREGIQRLRRDLELRRREAQVVCSHHSKALQDVSHSIEEAVHNLKPFQRAPECARFVSQIECGKWLADEAAFKRTLSTYIYKQFQEGVEAIAGHQVDSDSTTSTSDSTTSPSTSFLLLDSGQIDLQFVRGPRHADFVLNSSELRRINARLEESEVRSSFLSLRRVDAAARMREALAFLKRLQGKTRMGGETLRQETLGVLASTEAASQDVSFERRLLEEESVQVAQIERLRVVSGNYEVKIRRQEYLLGKHAFVKETLLRQLARLDLLQVVLGIEEQKISTSLHLLARLRRALSTEEAEAGIRLSNLEDLKEHALKDTPLAVERDLLQALFPQDAPGALPHLGSRLSASARRGDADLDSITEAKLKCVSKLYKSCEALEECLFGTNTAIGTVPLSWVDSDILARQAQLEQRSWELQHEMLAVLRDYEKKKKVLQDNPSLGKDLLSWTRQVTL